MQNLLVLLYWANRKKMKTLELAIVFAVLAVGVAADGIVHHNGQPGCKTEEELNVRLYRNNWDPTAYWVCSQKNLAADRERCPDSTLFLDEEKQCINPFDWYWTPPVEPPSRP